MIAKITSNSLILCFITSLNAFADTSLNLEVPEDSVNNRVSVSFVEGDSIYRVGLNSSITLGLGKNSLISKAKFTIKDGNNIILKDTVGKMVSLHLGENEKTLRITDETGTLTKGADPWSLYTHFTTLNIANSDNHEITVWAILSRGDFGSSKDIIDSITFTPSEKIYTIERNGGKILIIKIGTVRTA